jgi:hypothetical protein
MNIEIKKMHNVIDDVLKNHEIKLDKSYEFFIENDKGRHLMSINEDELLDRFLNVKVVDNVKNGRDHNHGIVDFIKDFFKEKTQEANPDLSEQQINATITNNEKAILDLASDLSCKNTSIILPKIDDMVKKCGFLNSEKQVLADAIKYRENENITLIKENDSLLNELHSLQSGEMISENKEGSLDDFLLDMINKDEALSDNKSSENAYSSLNAYENENQDSKISASHDLDISLDRSDKNINSIKSGLSGSQMKETAGRSDAYKKYNEINDNANAIKEQKNKSSIKSSNKSRDKSEEKQENDRSEFRPK